MKSTSTILSMILLGLLMATCRIVSAQTFVHPGGLHNQSDLDRMKTQVAAGAHPWIDDWNVLITDAKAQNTYTAAPNANMGASRQRASADAHAAYLNAIRWYVSGDVSFADCAINICNAWSSAVNQVPTGTDIPGLSGIPIFEFALAAEVLRISPRWAAADFTRFKNMMLTYWYPVCHDFLTNHNGACITNYWANWDAANIGAILSIGVLCDDRTKYNEAVTYFQSGAGTGSIMNAVYYIHSGNLGQWQESGRDQEHAQLGVGLLASVCEVAWKQGLDLYGYSSNRLLAGAEYVAQWNLWKSVPYTTYDNCQPANNRWVSINGRGRLDDRPVWEMIYNHYVVRKGLSAPNVTLMAQLMRPEHGSNDHFGYGTLTFTQNASTYPPLAMPPAPTGLTAAPGVGKVFLKWTPSAGNTAQGYRIQRSTTSGGSYTTLTSWTASTAAEYTDATVTNGTTYYYVVAAINQSGTSVNSAQTTAVPLAASTLPSGWARQDIGGGTAGTSAYANVNGNTFVTTSYGTALGGTSDVLGYTYVSANGDATFTARISEITGSLLKTGIMIRESLAADAATVSMTLGDAGWRYARMGMRTVAAGSMSFVLGNTYTWLPAWFRLQRSGNVFTAYESSDGVTWFTVGSVTIAMASSYYIGLVSTSGNATAVNTTTFDNVTVVGANSALNGTFKITNRASGKCLDNLGATTDGATVAQWTTGSSANQQWVITYSGGYHKLQCVTGGKYLDSYNNTADGSSVCQWASSTSQNQQWTITAVGSYVKFICRANGKCLDTGGGTSDGSVMQFWGNGTSNNQQWSLSKLKNTSGSVNLANEEEISAFDFYPNPVTDKLIIKTNCSKTFTAELYNSSGVRVVSHAFEGNWGSIDLNGISSGVYILKINDGQHLISKKIVKE